jgi:hypothetical protein
MAASGAPVVVGDGGMITEQWPKVPGADAPAREEATPSPR